MNFYNLFEQPSPENGNVEDYLKLAQIAARSYIDHPDHSKIKGSLETLAKKVAQYRAVRSEESWNSIKATLGDLAKLNIAPSSVLDIAGPAITDAYKTVRSSQSASDVDAQARSIRAGQGASRAQAQAEPDAAEQHLTADEFTQKHRDIITEPVKFINNVKVAVSKYFKPANLGYTDETLQEIARYFLLDQVARGVSDSSQVVEELYTLIDAIKDDEIDVSAYINGRAKPLSVDLSTGVDQGVMNLNRANPFADDYRHYTQRLESGVPHPNAAINDEESRKSYWTMIARRQKGYKLEYETWESMTPAQRNDWEKNGRGKDFPSTWLEKQFEDTGVDESVSESLDSHNKLVQTVGNYMYVKHPELFSQHGDGYVMSVIDGIVAKYDDADSPLQDIKSYALEVMDALGADRTNENRAQIKTDYKGHHLTNADGETVQSYPKDAHGLKKARNTLYINHKGLNTMKQEGLNEAFEAELEKLSLNESVTINTTASSEGQDTVTVTATDEDAYELVALLKAAGLPHKADEVQSQIVATPCGMESVEEEYANEPTDDAMNGDMDHMNTQSGGLNRRKMQQKYANPLGDNPLAESEDLLRGLWDLYKEAK